MAARYTTTAPKPAQFVYYLHSADGSVLYVGRSTDVSGRLRQHKNHAAHPENPTYSNKGAWFFESHSVSMVGPMPWDRAVAFERHQIETFQPLGNIRLTRREQTNRSTA